MLSVIIIRYNIAGVAIDHINLRKDFINKVSEAKLQSVRKLSKIEVNLVIRPISLSS